MDKPSVWKDCRKQEKNIRSFMIDRRRRAEKQKQIHGDTDPLKYLFVAAQPVTIIASSSQHRTQNSRSALIPSNADNTCLIDRYDARGLLSEPIAQDKSSSRYHLPRDLENLENMLNFERYKALIFAEHSGESRESCLRRTRLKAQYDHQLAPTEKELLQSRQNNGSRTEEEERDEEREHDRRENDDRDGPSLSEIARYYRVYGFNRLLDQERYGRRRDDDVEETSRRKSRKERRREKRRREERNRGETGSRSYRGRGSPVYEAADFSDRSSSDEEGHSKSETIQQIIIQPNKTHIVRKYPSDYTAPPTAPPVKSTTEPPLGVKEFCVVRTEKDRWKFAKEMDRKYNQLPVRGATASPAASASSVASRLLSSAPVAPAKTDAASLLRQQMMLSMQSQFNQKIQEDEKKSALKKEKTERETLARLEVEKDVSSTQIDRPASPERSNSKRKRNRSRSRDRDRYQRSRRSRSPDAKRRYSPSSRSDYRY